MNLNARPCDAIEIEEPIDSHAEYMAARIVDALLRENVRDCVARAVVVGNDALPRGFADGSDAAQRWLQITHFGPYRLWIPVVRERFMQSWRFARRALVWCNAAGCRRVYEVADILTCFRAGLDESAARGFVELEQECATAIRHRQAAETERERWFKEWRVSHGKRCGADVGDWHDTLLHYDRLAAFLDHPFYPTARAKLGFSADDLERYAPEFCPCFELNWIAVPRRLYHASNGPLPPGWPTFSQVGLPASLSEGHVLMPVHPFLWQRELERFLVDSGLKGNIKHAPHTALKVTPTLSVRTLALCDAPEWHVKLPLTIRTLGAKNIRTIKPSTINDGRVIQTLLNLPMSHLS
jgi:siderophore synthetase component